MDWRYLRRRGINILSLSGSVGATLVGLAFLFWILWVTLSYGVSAIDLALFTENTPAPGGPHQAPLADWQTRSSAV